MISLRKSGGIGINSAAIDEYMDDTEYVQLYYDDENNRLGIKPAEEGDENVYKLNKTGSSGGVTPTAWMKRERLIPEVTTRYNVEWDDDEEMLISDLNEDAGTYGSPDENTEDTADDE